MSESQEQPEASQKQPRSAGATPGPGPAGPSGMSSRKSPSLRPSGSRGRGGGGGGSKSEGGEEKTKKKGKRWWELEDSSGKVRGLARNKGERNPMKYGWSVDESILGHKALEYSVDLPPRDKEEYKVWKEKLAEKEAERKEARDRKKGKGTLSGGPGLLGKLFGKKDD